MLDNTLILNHTSQKNLATESSDIVIITIVHWAHGGIYVSSNTSNFIIG